MTKELDYGAIGGRIRALRRARGMTQEQLAEAAGISPSCLGHIERGTRILSLESLYGLSIALEAEMDTLATGREAAATLSNRAVIRQYLVERLAELA